jgi:hypothetical protein
MSPRLRFLKLRLSAKVDRSLKRKRRKHMDLGYLRLRFRLRWLFSQNESTAQRQDSRLAAGISFGIGERKWL